MFCLTSARYFARCIKHAFIDLIGSVDGVIGLDDTDHSNNTEAESIDDYNEYDYCEIQPHSNEKETPDTNRSSPLTSSDSQHYAAFYLTQIRGSDRAVRALLGKLEAPAGTISVTSHYRMLLVTVHKTVYMCDSLKRALEGCDSAVAGLIAIVNALCITVKKLILSGKELGLVGNNTTAVTTTQENVEIPKQMIGIHEELRSSYTQLIGLLERVE